MMKKGIAAFLAFSLTLQLFSSAGPQILKAESGSYMDEPETTVSDVLSTEDVDDADEQQPQQDASPEVTQSSKEEPKENAEKDVMDPIEIKGSIQVILAQGLALQQDQNIQVVLQSDGYKNEQEITIGVDDYSRHKVTFSELDKGVYTLHITADGFEDYIQTFEADGYEESILVYTGGAYQSADEHTPGVLAYQKDHITSSAMVDAIDSGSTDSSFDQNKDGSVDLLDLEYLIDHPQEPYTQITSTVEKRIPKEAAQVATDTGSIVSGTLEDMLETDGSVVLQPAKKEAISLDNPVEVSFDFTKKEMPLLMEGLIVQAPQDSKDKIKDGIITILYEEDGEIKTMDLPIINKTRWYRSAANASYVTVESDGSLTVHFHGQIAVKKVTIKITATTKDQGNLVEISKVEFLNDMENRIPAPEMNVPTNVKGTAGDKTFTISWDRQVNVTGYEIKVEADGWKEVYQTTSTSYTVTSFGKDKLKNKKDYTVSVQSVNGEWRSGYSNTIVVTPKTDKKPPRVDQVAVSGMYQSIKVNWKQMEDTDAYHVFYKEEGTDDFIKLANITETSVEIKDLKNETKYIVYVTGVNENGEGPASLQASARTLSIQPVQLPEYKLINTSNGKGKVSEHVISANRSVGAMINSTLDPSGTVSALGLVDHDFDSYYYLNDWDEAVSYHQYQWGLKFELDQAYTMDRVSFAAPADSINYAQAALYYWEKESNKEVKASGSVLQTKTDSKGRKYYTIKLSQPITSHKIRLGFTTAGGARNISVSEVRFYHYDSLEADIQALFGDDLHLTLADNVDQVVLDELQRRLDAQDHGEYHPDKAILQMELDVAKALYQDRKELNDIVMINTNITTKNDGAAMVGGLNAWQPLGITAAAQETIVIYVGNPAMKTGASSDLVLVAAQQHAESSNAPTEVTRLKVGRNEIFVPKKSSLEYEKGGALYVQYTGDKGADKHYAVRVHGGTSYPILNLYQVEDEMKRTELITSYLEELTSYVKDMKHVHDLKHQGQLESVDYDYDSQNCILNMTDITLDQMMLSVPASQILAGSGLGSLKEQVKQLSASLNSMNDMMTLFYQHKGLTNSFAQGSSEELIKKNSLPSRHLNIRYMRMFSGAFMYAGGNHIGIEWNETKGLAASKPVQYDENGKKISGQYFGWGIAHEIGHEINQGSYAIAEITNNYFSLLAQAADTNDSVRFQYSDVYDRVTSGIKGRTGSVFTQLAMYWQLHLAYDRDYNYKTYDTYQEIFDHLFFARVDSYARNTGAAPQPKGVALSLGKNADQNIMRLASAAAQKDLSDFFMRWGLYADETTQAYMEQFEKETRAIYYVNDQARSYEIEHGTASAITGKAVVNAGISSVKDNKVVISLDHEGVDADTILGYEITRCMYEQGKLNETVVGFSMENTYIDTINAISNRTIIYKITAIDQFLNRSQVVYLDPVKVEGDGSQSKTDWMITTTMTSEMDQIIDADEKDPCASKLADAAYLMIDEDNVSSYLGTAKDTMPSITIAFGKSLEVSALRYHASDTSKAIQKYKIEISQDGKSYQTIKEGSFHLKDGVETLYFENDNKDPWITTYDASYVRISAVGQRGKELDIAEIDILGPTGDNIEFMRTQDEVAAIGILKEAYVLQEKDDTHEASLIPAGSLVFTGNYKGNPAYNVLMLYDENGSIVGGYDEEGALIANQVILAPNPENAMLAEVSDGIWMYWIEPEHLEQLPKHVRGELYRVDNALNNEGQRLVSDTLYMDIPELLPEIVLKK